MQVLPKALKAVVGGLLLQQFLECDHGDIAGVEVPFALKSLPHLLQTLGYEGGDGHDAMCAGRHSHD